MEGFCGREAHLDGIVLAESELESVCFARIEWVCIKYLDVHKPVLKIVCPYKGYTGRELALHLERAVVQYVTETGSYVRDLCKTVGRVRSLAYLCKLLCAC